MGACKCFFVTLVLLSALGSSFFASDYNRNIHSLVKSLQNWSKFMHQLRHYDDFSYQEVLITKLDNNEEVTPATTKAVAGAPEYLFQDFENGIKDEPDLARFSLDDLKLADEDVAEILIASPKRSGSAILGRTFEFLPGVIYIDSQSPELLQFREEQGDVATISHVDSLLSCNLDAWMKIDRKLAVSCSVAKIRVLRLVDFTTELIEPLITNHPRIKAVQIIRDPRGVYNSLLRSGQDANSYVVSMCSSLDMNIRKLKSLLQKGNSFLLLRIEDLTPTRQLSSVFTKRKMRARENIARSLGMELEASFLQFLPQYDFNHWVQAEDAQNVYAAHRANQTFFCTS